MSKKGNVILLVDDDEAVNYFNKKLIDKSELDGTIMSLYNGAEAIREVMTLNNTLDDDDLVVVFLDINMPILNGWGFLENFNTIKYALNFKTEIYLLTSSVNPDEKKKAEENSLVKQYISKPLTVEKLNEIKLMCES
jgi:CheY-like chemotaxis protein